MKNKLPLLTVLTAAALSLTGCVLDLSNTKPTSIKLNYRYIETEPDTTFQLSATVQPILAFDAALLWSTSDQTIATVDKNGLVQAKQYGIAEITACITEDPTIKDKCIIDIKDFDAVLESIEPVDYRAEYYLGDDFETCDVYAHYKNGTQREVSLLCNFDGYDIQTVGKQTVTVSYSEGDIDKEAQFEIEVKDGENPNPTELKKTKMKYTYKDYAKNNAYGTDSCPTLGDVNILVIPVWFTDSSNFISSSYKESVRSDIEKAYFGTTTETGWQSVKSYYETESHGALNLTGTVTNWYSCGKASSYFSSANATCALIDTAADWYFNNNPTDPRRNYDADSNGYLDAVMVIYGAPDYQNYGSSDNMWAYCYWNSSNAASVLTPKSNAFFWASYDFMYSSGSRARNRTGSSYGNGDSSHCTIDAHTFIHEMGHVFGLQDYYDYSGYYTPAGSWTMQDHNVGGHDPFSTMAFGWTKPYIPTKSMTIKIKDFQSSGDVILLTPKSSNYTSPFDEYFLIEYYTATGLNLLDSQYGYKGWSTIPSGKGIRVWHVDSRLGTYDGRNISGPVCDMDSSKYVVFPATGNTAYSSETTGRMSLLGEDYYDFYQLQYVRSSVNATWKPTDTISNNNMFGLNSRFSMSNYSRQFVNGSKLDNNMDLGWSFQVTNLTNDEATIVVTKE